MSLESLPVFATVKLDPSTKAFIKRNLNNFAQLFNKWDVQNYDFVLANQAIHRFKNQQRHFIHFEEFCHLNRHLRRASTGRSNFCFKSITCRLESIEEIDQCISRNCIDFLLLALNSWHKDIVIIRSLAVNCWRHTELQMLTGHFVKLATLIMCVLSRIMILSEKSISSAVELYNALWAVRDQVPNVGLPVDYLSHLPQKMTFEPLIPLNKACTAFLKLAPEIDPLENNGTASSNGKYGAVVVPVHKKNSAQSNLFSEMGALPKVTSKPRSNGKSSGKVTPVVNNQKKTNHQKERKELLSLLRSAKDRSSKSSFVDMLFK